jgi:hypothetical protein
MAPSPEHGQAALTPGPPPPMATRRGPPPFMTVGPIPPAYGPLLPVIFRQRPPFVRWLPAYRVQAPTIMMHPALVFVPGPRPFMRAPPW